MSQFCPFAEVRIRIHGQNRSGPRKGLQETRPEPFPEIIQLRHLKFEYIGRVSDYNQARARGFLSAGMAVIGQPVVQQRSHSGGESKH